MQVELDSGMRFEEAYYAQVRKKRIFSGGNVLSLTLLGSMTIRVHRKKRSVFFFFLAIFID